jgi:hypothetical protein
MSGYSDAWGEKPALPSGSPIHIVMGTNYRQPGLLQRGYYTDPTQSTRSYDVELANAANQPTLTTVLGSGTSQFSCGEKAYYSVGNDTIFKAPKVVVEADLPGSSGLIYPYLVR